MIEIRGRFSTSRNLQGVTLFTNPVESANNLKGKAVPGKLLDLKPPVFDQAAAQVPVGQNLTQSVSKIPRR
jgi:hypothetical protein